MNYSDLPENPKVGVMLNCAWCMVEISARRSDYFSWANEQCLCPECRKPLALVQRRVRYVRISPKGAEARP